MIGIQAATKSITKTRFPSLPQSKLDVIPSCRKGPTIQSRAAESQRISSEENNPKETLPKFRRPILDKSRKLLVFLKVPFLAKQIKVVG
jgi:hypothetical protein